MKRKSKSQTAQELLESFKNLRRLRMAKMNNSDLRDSEKYVLLMIKNSERPVIPSQIAKRICVTMPAITHQIGDLEKKGLIVRNISKQDKRNLNISLTSKGNDVVKKLEREHLNMIYKLVDFLGEKDSKELVRIVSKIYSFMDIN